MQRLALALLLILAATARARGEEPPAPRLDRIDYGSPGTYLANAPAVGAAGRTAGVARQLAAKGEGPVGALSQIVRWVGRNLRTDAGKAKGWRGVDQILVDGSVGSESDRALVIGAMARAAGIPTTWVKALPIEFVREQKSRAAPVGGELGRVFLEVHLANAWHLLDPVTARLYADYDPQGRFLPDDHVAFDKGGDPYDLLLPSRFEAWRAQVAAYAARVQLPRAPWAEPRDLLAPWRVWITGQGGPASYAREACKTLGFLVEKTFNSGFETHLLEARGQTLIVTVQGGQVNLPEKYWARWLPPGHREILSGARAAENGWVAHRLPDGTRVILVTATEYGPVELAVSEALEG